MAETSACGLVPPDMLIRHLQMENFFLRQQLVHQSALIFALQADAVVPARPAAQTQEAPSSGWTQLSGWRRVAALDSSQ